MATELREIDKPMETAFAVDADLTWTETLAYQVTPHPVEGQGEVADYISSVPKRASLEGMITACPLIGSAVVPQKLSQARAALKELADKRQPVLVLSHMYAGYLAIERAEVTQTADGGMALKVSIGFVEIRTTTVGTAQVPASKLRAKVKRRGGSGKKGGPAQGSKPPQSTLAAGDDATGRRLSNPFKKALGS